VIFSHEPDKAEDFSGHRGSVKWQPYEFATLDTGFEAQKDSFRVALTLNEHTQHFQDLEYKFPLTLVIGSELNGVPDYISGQCDAQIGIPMYGLMGSINVASAFAIAIQHITTEFAVQCSSFSPIRADAARLLYGS
jgi:tRNA G18 (ribose-2'-O)-methylase SpoU